MTLVSSKSQMRSTHRRRILVAGCGYLGTALATRLAGFGHNVFALRRAVSELPPTLQAIEADLAVPNTLRRIPEIDHVFYLTATRDRGGGCRADARLLQHLVLALQAQRQRVRRLYVGSALPVYGDRDGDWVDEDSELGSHETEPGSALSQLEQAASDSSFPTTVLRLGELYGPRRPGCLAGFGRASQCAWPVSTWVNPIHVEDAVGAMGHLLDLRKPDARYLLVDREPTRFGELLAWASAHTKRAAFAPASPAAPASNVRAMSERLVETRYRFAYPTFREGYRSLQGL